jgi:hypothetical protein
MSQVYDGDQDIEIEQILELDLVALATLIAGSPAAMTILADALRDQMIKDSRNIGNLFGHGAQKQVPVAAQVQIPGTQRIS